MGLYKASLIHTMGTMDSFIVQLAVFMQLFFSFMKISEQDTFNLLVELLKECVILLKPVNQVCPVCWLERLQSKCVLDRS